MIVRTSLRRQTVSNESQPDQKKRPDNKQFKEHSKRQSCLHNQQPRTAPAGINYRNHGSAHEKDCRSNQSEKRHRNR
jgi:hypothetical protein